MAISSAKEMWTAGRINNGKNESTATLTYTILLATAKGTFASGVLEALTSPVLPAIGEGFPGASGLRCYNITGIPFEKTMTSFHVRCDYRQTIDPENPTEQDPTNYADKISYSTAKSTVAIEDDEAGDPLLNSADVQFKGLVKDHNDILITVQRNIDAGAIAHIKLYENHLNIGAWNGLASNTVLCSTINSRKVVDDTRTYYDITYQFDYREKGHRLRALNEGMGDMEGATYGPIMVGTGADARPTTEPLPLDAGGLYDPVGSFKNFVIYPQVDFDPLAITL